MNRFTFALAASAGACVMLGGCGGDKATAKVSSAPAAPAKPMQSAMVPPGQEATYFPFAVGNQWTFESTLTKVVGAQQIAPVRETLTYSITKVSPAPNGGQYAQFDIFSGSKLVDKQIWMLNKKGLYQIAVGIKLNRFSTPQTLCTFPVKLGNKVNWIGTVTDDQGQRRSIKVTSTLAGEELTDTATTTYNALTIESKGTMTGSNMKTQLAHRLWLVPKVGIARFRQEMVGEVDAKDPAGKMRKVPVGLVQLLKLKSFTPKK